MGFSHGMDWAKNLPAWTGTMVGLRDVVEAAYFQAAQIVKVPVIFH